MVLPRKHYKVYADIRLTVGMMSLVLPVLDTGAGPNLIRKSELPRGMEALISFRPTQDIGDSKKRLILTLGTLKIRIRLGRFVGAS